MIIIPGEFASQPQYNALIDPEWLARGLVIVCNPAVGAYNAVTKQFVTNGGGLTTTPTDSGKSWQGAASKYVDFGDTFAPSSRGATAIQVINPGTSANVFSFSSRAGSGSPGFEILIGNGGVAGVARARLDTVAITSDVTGLNDGRDHVLATRYTPSTELKIWADNLGKSASITSSIPASITPDQNLRLHSRGATYYTGKSGLFLYFDRPLSDSSVGALLQNPWQVFSPPKREILVSVGGGGGESPSVGGASGTSTVSGVGASDNAQSGSAAGIASVSGTGASTAETVGATSGSSTVSGVGASAAESVGVSDGVATASGVGASSTGGSEGSASGSASVSGVGASSVDSVGVAAGVASASGVGSSVSAAEGVSSGIATVSGVGDFAQAGSTVGTASGSSTVSGVSATVVAAVGNASGDCAVTGKGSSTGGVVEAYSGGYIISSEEHAERRKKQRIKLGIIEDDSLPAGLERFEISKLAEEKPASPTTLKDKLIPARLQKQQRLEQEKAELAYLVQLEAERVEHEEVQTILRMLMEL